MEDHAVADSEEAPEGADLAAASAAALAEVDLAVDRTSTDLIFTAAGVVADTMAAVAASVAYSE